MLLRQLFDEETYTYTYLLADLETRRALLIDPVLGKVERDVQLLRELGLSLVYALDTHLHADHVTGAGTLREQTGARVGASVRGAERVDLSLTEGDLLELGEVEVRVMETPGHTDDSLSYQVQGHVFTGDALWIRSCGRTDFQNGDPDALYDSITQRLFALADATVVWPGHDYRGQTQSTIGEEKRHNPRLAGKSREQFKQLMAALDLPRPRYMDVAMPANRASGLGLAAVDISVPGSFAELSVAAALDFIETGAATILDVREPHELDGHLDQLAGALHVPQRDMLEAALDLPLDTPLLVVSRSGRRSRRVCQALARRGFRRLANLRGGMIEYNEQRETAKPRGPQGLMGACKAVVTAGR